MARQRRRRSGRGLRTGVLLAALAGAAALGWYWYGGRGGDADASRPVHVRGVLTFSARPRDAQLGVSADAAVLFRDVRMLQWRERCAGDDCSYDQSWSAEAIDSARFRHPEGHGNPPLPFVSARFDAANLHLGPYAVDAGVVARVPTAPYAVPAGELPPNLAASFHVVDGALVAGGDPQQPQVGTIRISYRIVPAGATAVTALQRGNRLVAP